MIRQNVAQATSMANRLRPLFIRSVVHIGGERYSRTSSVLSAFGYLPIGRLELAVAFICRRERSGFDVIVVGVECGANDFKSVRIDSQEFWFEAGIKTEHVLVDQYLSAHVWPRPDTDSRNLEQVRYCSRALRGHTLEHDREASGIFQLARLAGAHTRARPRSIRHIPARAPRRSEPSEPRPYEPALSFLPARELTAALDQGGPSLARRNRRCVEQCQHVHARLQVSLHEPRRSSTRALRPSPLSNLCDRKETAGRR